MPFEPLDQYEQRHKKREEIAALGFDPFPSRFEATETVADVLARHSGATGEQLAAAQIHVRLAGRLMTLRLHGKAGFAHLLGAGARIQIYVKLDVVGEKLFSLFRLLDLGDIIGVRGHLFRTKTGELTVWVSELTLLSKALLPPPEKWHGLTDVEQRYRHRYVDLFANQGVRDIFLKRAQIIRETRAFFDARGYVEVETPMMHPIAGGAAARPFVTHHNTYDVKLYLRIAPELYLKRLIVGGLDRVYEINRNFRNEGVGYRWNPEFTMLEFYEAYSDYRALMDLTEQLVTGIVQKVNGSLAVTYGEHTVDFSRWHRLTMREAIVACWPAAAGKAPSAAELAAHDGLRAAAARYNAAARPESGIEPIRKPDALNHGELTAALFEGVCERRLIQPTLIYDFPIEVSPLSKRKPEDPTLVERFEFFAGGLELGNAFSELNDPEDQEVRFRQQVARGGEEAPKEVDLDYIRALCYGMPPTAGEGIGIDRLAMLLTNSHSIREVILFPLLRPEAAAPAASEGKPEAP